MGLRLPPRIHTGENQIRRVGVELEFSGLSLFSAAEVLSRVVRGRWRPHGDFTCDVYSPLGEFRVEFDSSFFKKKKYAPYLEALGLSPETSVFGRSMEDALTRLGELVIPFEVITPPLPITHLEVVEDLREELRLHAAKGTRSSPFRAFGLQFNPEVPDLSAETIHGYLKAFFVLFDWIYDDSQIPLSRKIAPYIHSFPQEYVELTVNPDYRPNMETLIYDYLRFNPTRNRPLDLLPLFSYINKAIVFSFPVEKELVKARPTFHYRLPNSQIDDYRWTIAREWDHWIDVENLAFDTRQLEALCLDYHLALKHGTFARPEWIRRTKDRMHV